MTKRRRPWPSKCGGLAVLVGLWLAASGHVQETAGASAESEVAASSPTVRTILLDGHLTTWLTQPRPPYNIVITIKMKLERAGYRVVLEATQPHEAVLAIDYRETPGRQYRALEQGTNIRCELTLRPSTSGMSPPIWQHTIETGTSWPTPIGSVYWDAVQNLEEDPYYHYLAELLRGHLDRQEGAAPVFVGALQEGRPRAGSEGGGILPTARETGREGARLNAIAELGRLRHRGALPLLWILAQTAPSLESDAALLAIGEIGGPEALDRLGTFAEAQQDPDVKAVARRALARARELQVAP
jgi:hypothetical protein